MAEEKKPKIDLKARLANKTAAAQPAATGSVPPPAGIPAPVVAPPAAATSGGGIPAPVVAPVAAPPATASGGGIPVPPFATPARGGQPPNPFAPPPAAPAPPPPPPRPQDIKIEIGAEAVEAAKQMKKFIVVAGVAGSLAGMAIGYVVGQGSANSKRETQAISGAAELSKDVTKANEKIKALNDKIGEAVKTLAKDHKFPDTFAKELGDLDVPFDGDKLVGRSVGAYDSATLNALFSYTSDVQALNARRDALKSLFIGSRKRIEEALEAGQKPTIAYTLLVIPGPKGPVGSLAPVQDAFPIDQAEWPKTFKMTNLVSKEVQEVTRYTSGDILSTRDKRIGIPIEPQSLGAAFPNDISTRILSELAKTGELLQGVEGQGEDETRPGLLKTGAKLVESLNKIAAKRKLSAVRRSRASTPRPPPTRAEAFFFVGESLVRGQASSRWSAAAEAPAKRARAPRRLGGTRAESGVRSTAGRPQKTKRSEPRGRTLR
jgi:hypothetical protein